MYMSKLIEHNENLDTPLYLPSHLESLKEKHDYFEVPDLETSIQRQNIPHYLLQRDFAQIKHFQYRFSETIILNEDIVPQIKIFSHFRLKFFDLTTKYYGNNKIRTQRLTSLKYSPKLNSYHS